MSRTTIVSILQELGVDPSLLVDAAHMFADLQLDSTEAVEVTLSIRKSFGVEVELKTSSDITLAQLCAHVDALVQDQARTAV